jgi:two-component system, NtrC family, nitrogen regulation sensor histidine kinase GlnL
LPRSSAKSPSTRSERAPLAAALPTGDALRSAAPAPGPAAAAHAFAAFDHLATMVAVVSDSGACVFANASFENVLGLARRSVQQGSVFDWFVDAQPLRDTVAAVSRNDYATSRLEALLHRPGSQHGETLPVLVIVNQMEASTHVVVELLEIEQQARQDREERALGQAQVTKELIRNLAHEIKNPLGGIRGAAQLLGMEVQERSLLEYTQVIINEADRLQALVDRLLAPHRKPHVVSDVNIHEVCERVRALILAEFPRGLSVERDYDISIPEFRGDREQLIQAVLNIAHNAAQALAARIEAGDARIVLRTRIARQVTLGKKRYRLALELHIEDNGPGVPESIRDRVFYPMVSGRDGGSGLGLTLAQTFVQQHAGTIACDSAAGRTVFEIMVPLP